jgi:hypothetical protein
MRLTGRPLRFGSRTRTDERGLTLYVSWMTRSPKRSQPFGCDPSLRLSESVTGRACSLSLQGSSPDNKDCVGTEKRRPAFAPRRRVLADKHDFRTASTTF